MNPVDPTHPVPVAIIGMSCLFPQADGLSGYWANIRRRRDAITAVPETHWRLDDYYDPDPKAPDRTYARAVGFSTRSTFRRSTSASPPITSTPLIPRNSSACSSPARRWKTPVTAKARPGRSTAAG